MSNLKASIFGITENHVLPELRSIIDEIAVFPYSEETLIEPMASDPGILLCYQTGEGSEFSILEVAQALRANYPENQIFFIATQKKDFDKKRMVKNGFNNAFLLPWEKSELFEVMQEEKLFSRIPELRGYRPVKVVDLSAENTLDFDLKLFMPLNGKLVHLASAGTSIGADKLAKISDANSSMVYIKSEDLPAFYQYTAKVLKKTSANPVMSETEKQQKLKLTVRELVSEFFIEDNRENTFSKSQGLLSSLKGVIDLMMEESNPDLMAKLKNLMNQQNGFYQHTSNVGTFAGLFGLVLGYEKPEDLALAGVLHDLGKVNLPSELSEADETTLTGSTLEAYKQHPNFTLDVLKLKRMVISDATRKAILQHHEALNGTGYPEKLDGRRISREGRILAIADRFDYLTSVQAGRPALSAGQALKGLLAENSADPGKVTLDVDIIRGLISLFMPGNNET